MKINLRKYCGEYAKVNHSTPYMILLLGLGSCISFPAFSPKAISFTLTFFEYRDMSFLLPG